MLAAGRLADVRGAFALAWRDPDGTLNLARDPVGERTLFYAPLPDGLLFAASIPDLLRTGQVPRRLHLPAVATYLAYAYLPGRETLVENVYELLPGEHLRWRDGRLERSFYWSLPPEDDAPRGEEELRVELRAALERATRRLLPPGDEPVAAFLSGGLDSSLVVALARALHRGPVHTYSLFFGHDTAHELAFSSLVAEHCRTAHTIVELPPSVVLHYLDDCVALLSDPIGDPLTVPNALLFREAAAASGVVLNGEGGDPCFGGPKNLPMVLSELYSAEGEPHAREKSYLRAHLKCYDDLPDMLTPDLLDALAAEPLEAKLAVAFADPRWRRFVTRLQAINLAFKGAHHILPKVDALSVPAGLVPRAPLFDRDVVELAFATPPGLKLHGSVEKYLLKRAVEDLLPRAVLDRPKSGMLVPVEAWFRPGGPLHAAARERLFELAPRGLVRGDYLKRLLDYRLGAWRPRHGAKVWLLLTLEAWLRRVLAA